MTSQEHLALSVRDTAESGHEFMLDPNDENFRDVIETFREGSYMTLVVTTGGPHITIDLPSGQVKGTWGNSGSVAQMPPTTAKELYEYFNR